MARYVTRVRTPMSAEKAFDYMADLRRFAEWDPGVRRAVQVEGDGGGPDAVFDVTVASVGPDLTLRYRTTEYDAPRSFRVVATSFLFTSDDRIRVETDAARRSSRMTPNCVSTGCSVSSIPGCDSRSGGSATGRRPACARRWAASRRDLALRRRRGHAARGAGRAELHADRIRRPLRARALDAAVFVRPARPRDAADRRHVGTGPRCGRGARARRSDAHPARARRREDRARCARISRGGRATIVSRR